MPRYVPARIDLLQVRAGDAMEVTFRFDPPVNLSGLEGLAHVRTTPDATTTVLEFTDINLYMTPTDISLVKDSAAMAALRPGRYVYDIQVKSPGLEDVQTLVYGDFIVVKNVTRA